MYTLLVSIIPSLDIIQSRKRKSLEQLDTQFIDPRFKLRINL
jgi:hypothetical protein